MSTVTRDARVHDSRHTQRTTRTQRLSPAHRHPRTRALHRASRPHPRTRVGPGRRRDGLLLRPRDPDDRRGRRIAREPRRALRGSCRPHDGGSRLRHGRPHARTLLRRRICALHLHRHRAHEHLHRRPTHPRGRAGRARGARPRQRRGSPCDPHRHAARDRGARRLRLRTRPRRRSDRRLRVGGLAPRGDDRSRGRALLHRCHGDESAQLGESSRGASALGGGLARPRLCHPDGRRCAGGRRHRSLVGLAPGMGPADGPLRR